MRLGDLLRYSESEKQRATLGVLLELANDRDAKSISVKVSLPSNNTKKPEQKAKPKSKSGQGTSPGEERKLMRDLLKHHDEAFIFHRQKSAEHAAFVDYHSKVRGDSKHRILALLNKQALDHHNSLRQIYRKIGDQAYALMKPSDDKKPDKVAPRQQKSNKKPAKPVKGKGK